MTRSIAAAANLAIVVAAIGISVSLLGVAAGVLPTPPAQRTQGGPGTFAPSSSAVARSAVLRAGDFQRGAILRHPVSENRT